MLAPPLKRLAKSVLRQLAPQTFGDLMSRRSNRYARQVLERDGVPQLAADFVAAHGLQVRAGPFSGMHYVETSVGSVFIPKLLGSYECELHAALEKALARPPSLVVDIGCAEGYYSVGAALRLPDGVRVHAFDTDPGARQACARLALRNGVAGRVIVGGFCDADALTELLGAAPRGAARPLLICDCEGYEAELLDPQSVPPLIDADLIVELHEQARPGVTDLLEQRFAATHHIELIDARPRYAEHHPLLQVLPAVMRARAISEYRGGPQQWAVMSAGRRTA